MIKVLVNGACGRMGTAVLRAVTDDSELELVAAVDRKEGIEVGKLIGEENIKLKTQQNLKQAIEMTKPDVMVDFTNPASVYDNVMTALNLGVSPVIGTTGLSEEQKGQIDELSRKQKVPAFIAANFAIGAVLMMTAARKIAEYMPQVEIIEMHHDRKLDAPSGTAITTAEMISEVRKPMKQGHPDEEEKLAGARGAEINGIPIHSVRLPGFVASQAVIFGGLGQTLTLRHDTIDRTSFMPGVVLACKKVQGLEGLVRNLENIL